MKQEDLTKISNITLWRRYQEKNNKTNRIDDVLPEIIEMIERFGSMAEKE